MDFLLLLDITNTTEFCAQAGVKGMMSLIGLLITVIKIVVPLILIVFGMIEMGKSVMGKDEDAIKKAQGLLIKKMIAAVVVFLVATIVGLVMPLVGGDDFKQCGQCVNNPFQNGCLNSIGKNVVDSQ
ncbi:MAG: hypothetical protein RSD96_02075 [Bacilli bacterium]